MKFIVSKYKSKLMLETAVDTSSRRWADEDVIRVILDAFKLSIWFAEVEDDFLDTIFSLTRSLQTEAEDKLEEDESASPLYGVDMQPMFSPEAYTENT